MPGGGAPGGFRGGEVKRFGGEPEGTDGVGKRGQVEGIGVGDEGWGWRRIDDLALAIDGEIEAGLLERWVGLGESGLEALGEVKGEVAGAIAGVLLDEEPVLAEGEEAEPDEEGEGKEDEAGLAAE